MILIINLSTKFSTLQCVYWSEFNDKSEGPDANKVKQKFNDHHVYSQREQKEVYIEMMLLSMMEE